MILAPNGQSARRELAFQGRYEGATYSTRRSYIPASVQSARFDANSSTRIELLRKARYFERNSPIVNRLADLFEAYTVGTGLQVNPASADADWNARAKSWWEGWCQYPDLTSRQSFGTLQGLIARTWFIDGESFVLFTRGQSNRPRLQLLEGHLVATPPELAAQEGKTVIDGVAVDGNGRPVSYYVAEDRGSDQKRTYTPRPADFVHHLFEPSRPGQMRGLSFLHPVINTLHDLDDMQILETDAAREHASVAKIIKTASGEYSDEDAVRGTQTTGVDGRTKADYYRDVIDASVKVLQTGDEYNLISSNRPSVVTQDFWRYLTEAVCAGVGIPYVMVYPDSMQGTVYRGALDMANSFFRARSMVIADAVRRIWAYVIGAARYTERELVDAPPDWANITIQSPRATNVDVGRNSAARLAELQAGATTYRQHYGELGLDWEDQFAQVARERARMAELGIATAQPSQPSAPTEPDGEEDEEVIRTNA